MPRKIKSYLILAAALALSGAAAAAQARDYPQPLNRESVGDWMVECFDPQPTPGTCQIYQRMLTAGGSDVVMVTTLAYRGSELHLQMALPLGVDLVDGVVIDHGADAVRLGIARCTGQGCIVEGPVDAALLDGLARGESAAVRVSVPVQGPLDIPLSLQGFAHALARIAPEDAPVPTAMMTE